MPDEVSSKTNNIFPDADMWEDAKKIDEVMHKLFRSGHCDEHSVKA